MARSPFEIFLTKYAKDVVDTVPINPYDDGSIWSDKVSVPQTRNYSSGFENYVLGSKQNPLNEIDSLEQPRNQMNYYTNKFKDSGLNIPEPSVIDKKESIGSKALNKTFDFLQVLGTPVNAIAGSVNELVDTIGNKQKQENPIKDIFDIALAGIKSGGATFLAPLNKNLREHRVDISNVLDTMRNSQNSGLKFIADATDEISPIYGLSRAFGAKHDTAKNISGTVNALALDIALSQKFDIDGLGKALKVVNKSDELSKVASATGKLGNYDETLETALNTVKKFKDSDITKMARKISGSSEGEGYEEVYKLLMESPKYEREAKNLIKQVDKKLGGIGDFEGLKMGKKVLLNNEQLAKIGSTKTGKAIANIAGGYLNPFSEGYALLSGNTPKWLSEGSKITKMFGGGKNQDYLKNAYEALQDNDMDRLYSSIQAIKETNAIRNMKHFNDSNVYDKALTLQTMLDDKGVDSNKIMNAIEMHGTPEVRREFREIQKLNPKYAKEAAKYRDFILRELEGRLKQQNMSIKDFGIEDINDLERVIDNLDNMTIPEAVQKEEFNPNTISKTLGFKDFNVDNNIDNTVEGILPGLKDNAEYTGLSYNTMNNVNINKSEANKPSGVLSKLFRSDNLDNLQSDLDKLATENVNKNVPDFSDWKMDKRTKQYKNLTNTDLIGDSQSTPKTLDELKKIEDMNKLNETIDYVSKGVTIDGRTRQSISQDGVNKIVERYKELGIDLPEEQVNRIKGLLKYEGDNGEIIDDIKGELDFVTSKQTFREKSRYNGELQSERVSKLLNETKRKPVLFNNESDHDFLYWNEGFAKIEEALSLRKLINTNQKTKIESLFGNADSFVKGQKRNTKDVQKIFDRFIASWEGKMPEELYKNVLKNKAEIVDSFKYLSDEELDMISKHTSTWFSKPTRINKDVVGSLKDYKLTNDLMNKDYENIKDLGEKEFEAQQSRIIREAEKTEAMDIERQKWLNRDYDAKGKPKYALNESNNEWEMYEQDLNMLESTKQGFKKPTQQDNHKKLIQIAKKAEQDLSNGIKYDKLTKQDKYALLYKSTIDLNNKISNDNPDLLRKIKALSVDIEPNKRIGFEKNLLKTTDNINNSLSKLVLYDDEIKSIFEAEGQLGVYKYISEKTGNKNLWKLESKEDFSTLDKVMNDFMTKRAIKNTDLRPIVGAKNIDNIQVPKQKVSLSQDEQIEKLSSALGLSKEDIKSGLFGVEPKVDTPIAKVMDKTDTVVNDNPISKVVTKENKINNNYNLRTNGERLQFNKRQRNKVIKSLAEDGLISDDVVKRTSISKAIPEDSVVEVAQKRYDTLLNVKPNDVIKNANAVIEKENLPKIFNDRFEIRKKIAEVEKSLIKRDGKYTRYEFENLISAEKDLSYKIKELSNQPVYLYDKKKTLEQIKSVLTEYNNVEGEIYKTSDNIKKILIGTEDTSDMIEWFEAQGVNTTNEKFVKVKDFIDVLSSNYDLNTLNESERKIADFLHEAYKDMDFKEGLHNPEDLSEYFGYLPHIMNGDLKDDTRVIELSKKLGFDIKNPFSVHHMERKMQGSIEALNKYMENSYGVKDFFETNLVRQYADRALKSNNYITKKNLSNMMSGVFERELVETKMFKELDINQMKNILKSYGVDTESFPDIPQGIGETKRFTDIDLKHKDFKNNPDMLGVDVVGLTDDNKISTVKYSERHLVKPTKGTERQLLINKYYDLINDIKNGKHERFVVARVNPEFEEKNFTILNDLYYMRRQVPLEFRGEGIDLVNKGKDIDFDKMKLVDVTPENSQKEMLKLMEQQNAGKDIGRDLLEEALNTKPKEPYIQLKPDELSNKTIEELVKEGYTVIDRNILNQYNSITDGLSKNKATKFDKWYSKAMNIFKAWAVTSPGFHINNYIGNQFNSVLQVGMDVFNPEVQKESYNLLKQFKEVGFDYTKLHGSYKGISYSDIMKQSIEGGVLNGFFDVDLQDIGRFARKETAQIGENISPVKKMFKKLNPLDVENNVITNTNKNIGEFIEQQGKLSNMFAHMKQGRSIEESIDLVQAALFDYMDITDFEESVVKKYISPFYTFAKKNFPYQSEKIANNPMPFQMIEKFYRYMDKGLTTEKERMLRPDYVEGSLKVGKGKYLNVDTPLNSLVDMFEPKELYAMLNPFVKNAVDVAYNTKSFSGSEISKSNNPKELASYYLESVAPFIRTGKTLGGLASDDEINKEKAFRFLLGNKIKEYDVDKSERQALYDYVTQLQNKWYDETSKNKQLSALAKAKEEERKGNKKVNIKKSKNPLYNLIK